MKDKLNYKYLSWNRPCLTIKSYWTYIPTLSIVFGGQKEPFWGYESMWASNPFELIYSIGFGKFGCFSWDFFSKGYWIRDQEDK